jgi:sec-independent protein translocase protein TatC
LLATPVIFYQIWRFIAPGLYQHEKKALIPFTVISTCCFFSGAAFGYFVVFPPAFRFLVGYASEILEPLPGVSEYFSLSLRLLMVFLGKIGVVDAGFLRRNRKYALLISFIIAAILTPTPDVVNQLLMAGPLIVLYEVSIFAVALFARKTLSDFNRENDHPESDSEKENNDSNQASL